MAALTESTKNYSAGSPDDRKPDGGLPSGPVVFIDGECAFCSWSARFLIRHDKKREIYFAVLGGPAAKRILGARADDEAFQNTMLLLDNGVVYSRSDAVLRTLAKLGGGWCAVSCLLWLPRLSRDFVYRITAALRYRLMGRAPSCGIISDVERARFIEN